MHLQATDIYSLGTVLYELVAGKHPFPRESASSLELARLICESVPEPPGTAAGLNRIVLQAMGKKPAVRYPLSAYAIDLVVRTAAKLSKAARRRL